MILQLKRLKTKNMNKLKKEIEDLKNQINKNKKDKNTEDYYKNIKPGNIPPPHF